TALRPHPWYIYFGRTHPCVLEKAMRLESVTLHGFKSFGEKTVVKVLPGITAIVGPNGCGKTNLAEAVRWALGEQSSRSLRGHRMHVLTAKPRERRVFIEEAAGIARYKQQRNETQGKLDATRQNLVRVRDVMDEVKRQLSSLERQAKKAQQYKALQTTKRDLALAVLA